MPKPPASWDLYRTFLDVVRDGSLTAAARRLGLTQPTAGRHIAALEAAVGTALFTRSPRGLLPTQAALELVPHAEAMAAAEAAFRRSMTGAAVVERGVVRLTASDIVACEILPPILAQFCDAHRAIEVELSASNRVEDLLRRDADIAVRTGRPSQKALIARRLGAASIGLFAHPRYLARHGTPNSMQDLAGHRLIGFDRDDSSFRAVRGAGPPITRDTFTFRTDNDLAQIAAIRAGLGIGGMQARLAARDNLVPILPDVLRFEVEYWLTMHEDLKTTKRVRLLFDCLAAALTAFWPAPANEKRFDRRRNDRT
jgi:DNA-binding transcriptional LysR family regulator